jgi:peptidoglycan hydrolase-like protein with peptidoglycan-binding domain
MELTGNEPDLELGDSGEGVVLLQVRLYQLRMYRQFPDGTYDMFTENAVREFQSMAGLDNDGEVTRATWEAILHYEQQYGIQYQYVSPYDALDQLRYDLEHPAGSSGNFPGGDPSLSEDGLWRWDGNDWQATGGPASQWGDSAGYGPGGYGSGGQLSPDGQSQWNGTEWVAVAAADPYAGQVSPDGQWRWDGQDWRSAQVDDYVGQLSPDGQWRWNGQEWATA